MAAADHVIVGSGVNDWCGVPKRVEGIRTASSRGRSNPRVIWNWRRSVWLILVDAAALIYFSCGGRFTTQSITAHRFAKLGRG